MISAALIAVRYARCGYIGEYSLCQLVRRARDHGLAWLDAQIEDDPALLWMAGVDMALPMPWLNLLTAEEARVVGVVCDFFDIDG